MEENLEENLAVLRAELVFRNYRVNSINAAFDRVRLLCREEVLKKVPRTPNQRVVLSLPFDKR